MVATTVLRGWVLALAAGLVMHTAMAQGSGVRFALPEFGNAMKGYHGFRNLRVGVGFERRMANGLGFGIDACFAVVPISLDGAQRNLPPITVENRQYTYHEKVKDWTVTYRSSYYFGQGDGFYMGTFFGVRVIRHTATRIDGYGSLGNANPIGGLPAMAEANGLVFPVGIRVGVSTELDAHTHDLYVQLGTQLGAGPKAFGVPKLDEMTAKKADFIFMLGYTYGLGW